MKMNVNLGINPPIKRNIRMKLNMNVKMKMKMTLQMEMRCCRFAGSADDQIKAVGEDGRHSAKIPKTSHRIELR
jgi:hypothetical protein